MLTEPQALDEAAAGVIASWRYPGSLSVYDVTAPLDPRVTWVVRDHEGTVVGYVVLGHEARIAGQDEDPGAVDVGWGMNPALIRRGGGGAFVRAAVDVATQEAARRGRSRLRSTILHWNDASIRSAVTAGFRAVDEASSPAGRFVVLERLATPGSMNDEGPGR